MWKCEKCGRYNQGNFCSGCGAPGPETEVPEMTTTPTASKKSGAAITLVVCVVILTMVLVGVVVAELVRRLPENNIDVKRPASGETAETTESPTDIPEEGTVENATPTPVPTKKSDTQNTDNRYLKKQGFLESAREIERYEANARETAMTQWDMNHESGVVFSKWDALLNEVYQYLKKTLPSSEFETLRKEEIAWINEKEAACERAAQEWEGGSGAPMAVNETATEYTKARVYELINMID